MVAKTITAIRRHNKLLARQQAQPGPWSAKASSVAGMEAGWGGTLVGGKIKDHEYPRQSFGPYRSSRPPARRCS